MAAAALPRTRWKANKEEQADLDAMNVAVARIQKHTPTDPYYLEIPQKDGARYNHHQSQRHQWTRDTPFARTEMESLQYQTFHLYEQGTEMFEQHSTRLEAAVSNRPAIARVGTPSTAPKNKISLAAYKKKQSAATTTPELKARKAGDAPGKQAAVKGPVERAKAETEEMLAAIAETEPDVPVPRRKESQAIVHDLKRKRDDHEREEGVGERKAEARIEDVEPARKKARPVEDRPVGTNAHQKKPGAVTNTNGNVASGTSRVDEHQLPPRLSPALSPLLPARLSPLPNPTASIMPLPPRLTSTIPLNISKTLDAQKGDPSLLSAADINSKEKDPTLTPSKKETSKLTKHKSPLPPRNGFRAGSSSPAVRMEAEQRPPATTSRPRQNQSQDDEVMVAKAKKGKTESSPSILQKPRLLLKLKYRKSQANAIKRILGMRVTKKTLPATQPDVSDRSAEELKSVVPPDSASTEPKDGIANTKGVAQKVGPAKKEKKQERQPTSEKRPPTEKPSILEPTKQQPAERRPAAQTQPAKEKRPLPDEDRHESSAKRIKDDASTARKGPSTPAQQVIESPSGSKAQLQATPSARNNRLAVAMARDKSQDSISTQTPPAAADTPSTTSISQPNGIVRPPSSQPSTKTAMEQAWGAEARHYSKLGKELKHAATAHLNNIPTNAAAAAVSLLDQKLAAVKSIESFLSFMIGFVCLDEAGQAAEPRAHPPEIRNWRTLLGFQGFVKRNTENFSGLAGLTASLNVVFAQRTLEIATQYHRADEAVISRNEIFDMQALLTKSAVEAEGKLDGDVLQEMFPRAWGRRTKRMRERGEKLEVGKLDGEFKLPIGLGTSPLRAVRAGVAILREWVDGEGLRYSLKLKLGG